MRTARRRFPSAGEGRCLRPHRAKVAPVVFTHHRKSSRSESDLGRNPGRCSRSRCVTITVLVQDCIDRPIRTGHARTGPDPSTTEMHDAKVYPPLYRRPDPAGKRRRRLHAAAGAAVHDCRPRPRSAAVVAAECRYEGDLAGPPGIGFWANRPGSSSASVCSAASSTASTGSDWSTSASPGGSSATPESIRPSLYHLTLTTGYARRASAATT